MNRSSNWASLRGFQMFVAGGDESTNHPNSHRWLEEDAEPEINDEPKEFNPLIFWSVNAIWITVLLAVVIWFWKFNGAQRITNWTSGMGAYNSDLEYRRRRQRQREQEEERKKVPPETRRKILSKYFRSTKVHMVVAEGDIISDPVLDTKSHASARDTTKKERESQVASKAQTEKTVSNAKPSVAKKVETVTGDQKKIARSRSTENIARVPSQKSLPRSNSVKSLTKVSSQQKPRSNSAKAPPKTIKTVQNETNVTPKAVNDVNSKNADEMDASSSAGSRRGSFSWNIFANMSAPESQSESEDIETGVVRGMDASVSTLDQGYLVLKTKDGVRHVPNCCAVCLSPYEVGDDVVWSDNDACRHAFHEECVTDWLVKMQDGNPCPCCRSVFVDMDAVKYEPGKTVHWSSTNTMNLGVIRL